MSPSIGRTRRGLTLAPPPAFAVACMLCLPGPVSPFGSTARADLLLNEVLYDPVGADLDREFVEIWNPDSIPVPLDDVALEGGDGARPGVWEAIWRGPAGGVAPPGGAVLVAGNALLGALQNGPDALRLTRAGAVLDLLGYGDLESAALYEGSPAPDVASGQSLARIRDGIDTGVNRDDWAADGEPTPGLANHPDLRLSLSRSSAVASPEVAWPGDPVALRVWARNSGRLAVDKERWAVQAEIAAIPSSGESDSSAEWSAVASTDGVSIAPNESALVSLEFPTPAPGAWLARARIRDLPGWSGAAGEAALADTLEAPFRSIAGPAVLSEIAFRDAGAGEWVEIWFRGAVDDVGRLAIADAVAEPRPIDSGGTPRRVEAGTTLVVAQDPPLVRARFGLADSVVLGLAGGWPPLNDTGAEAGPADRIRLVGAGGVPCDAVPYWATSSVRGGSLERLSVDLPSAAAGTWVETIDPRGGTPGRENSMHAPASTTAARGPLLVAGSRVLRRRDGGAVPVVLRATASARGRRLTVRVHDLLGRPLRTLVEGQRFASEGAFVWDGRDDRGAPVPPGIYVIRAEALPEENAGARASSVTMAVAAERPK